MTFKTFLATVNLTLAALVGACDTRAPSTDSGSPPSTVAELTIDDGAGGERGLTPEELKGLLETIEQEIQKAERVGAGN